MKELWIDEKTAQLVLDALAWSNDNWLDSLGWKQTDEDKITIVRSDFIRFCKDRGIAGVEKVVEL